MRYTHMPVAGRCVFCKTPEQQLEAGDCETHKKQAAEARPSVQAQVLLFMLNRGVALDDQQLEAVIDLSCEFMSASYAAMVDELEKHWSNHR